MYGQSWLDSPVAYVMKTAKDLQFIQLDVYTVPGYTSPGADFDGRRWIAGVVTQARKYAPEDFTNSNPANQEYLKRFNIAISGTRGIAQGFQSQIGGYNGAYVSVVDSDIAGPNGRLTKEQAEKKRYTLFPMTYLGRYIRILPETYGGERPSMRIGALLLEKVPPVEQVGRDS